MQESVTLLRRPVMHVVGHVWGDEREIHRGIKIGQGLNLGAFHWLESDALKTDGRIMLAHILASDARSINSAEEAVTIVAVPRVILLVNAPCFSSGKQLFGEVVG